LPLEAASYPVPKKISQRFHLRRYGFGGILHKGAYDAAGLKARRVLSIILRDDVSITAILDGVAVDTTTGFTQAEGLPGLHRSGSLDPRIPLHFAMHLGASAHHIDQLFSTKCGIVGMTGKDSYAAITRGAAKDPACVDALMLLSYRIAQAAAGMAMAMGGLDAIIFSGDPESWAVQEEVCRRLSFLGVKAKRSNHRVTHTPRSKVKVCFVQVFEDDALYAQGLAAVGK
jgi:acetate kinase